MLGGEVRTNRDQLVEEKNDRLRALDAALINTIRRRIELAQEISEARLSAGHPRTTHTDELAVVRKFRQLGASGAELAVILLRLSRGGPTPKWMDRSPDR